MVLALLVLQFLNLGKQQDLHLEQPCIISRHHLSELWLILVLIQINDLLDLVFPHHLFQFRKTGLDLHWKVLILLYRYMVQIRLHLEYHQVVLVLVSQKSFLFQKEILHSRLHRLEAGMMFLLAFFLLWLQH